MANVTGKGTPFDPALPPSSCLLFYLFAEQMVPAARLGTATPLAHARLNTDRLASTLFNVAFWSLRESGLVRLELAGDVVRVARTSFIEDHWRDGIEGGILQVLTPDPLGNMTAARESLPTWLEGFAQTSERLRAHPPQLTPAMRAMVNTPRPPPGTVTEVVTRWYGAHVRNPERVPITWMEREAVAKGCFATVNRKRGLLATIFSSKTVLVPERDQIVTLAPRFADLLKGWQAFQAHERDLFSQLERDVVAGIDARRDNSDTGSAT